MMKLKKIQIKLYGARNEILLVRENYIFTFSVNFHQKEQCQISDQVEDILSQCVESSNRQT